MFRLERMDKDRWWACCYLDRQDGTDRVGFWIRREGKQILIDVTEQPPDNDAYVYEAGSL